jgi:hypothetical protein
MGICLFMVNPMMDVQRRPGKAECPTNEVIQQVVRHLRLAPT